MKHYRAKPSAHLQINQNTQKQCVLCMHMHSSNSYGSRVTTRMQCSCGITRYYVIADHVCAKSADDTL